VTAPKPPDKRVYDIRANGDGNERWFVLSISADATLADLHLALLGAFEWSGFYSGVEGTYRFEIGGRRFEDGKGSRTALRKLLEERGRFSYACDAAGIAAGCSVVGSYEVPNRRHYPKVVEARSSTEARHATWRAQIAVRREYRDHERNERLKAGTRRPAAPRGADSAYAHGFFSALVAGPMVAPANWLQRFLAPRHESIEELNAGVAAAMDAYNEVADRLLERREGFAEATLAFARRDADGGGLIEWHRGFLDAMDLNQDAWAAFLSRIPRDLLQPLAAIAQCSEDPSKGEWLRDRTLRENLGWSLGLMTARLWEEFREEPSVQLTLEGRSERRKESSVGRNEPCPCGSGKKYKRCCGSTLRSVDTGV
jgi:uncharacterized protein